MARLDITLSEDLKACISDHAADQGLSAAAYVRQLIERDMMRVNPDLAPLVFSIPMRDEEPMVRFTVGLTASEKQALERRAELMGCSQSRWIVCAIRALLTREPQPFTSEIEQFKESNYRLLSIVRDMNIVARTVQSGQVPDSFEGLRGMIGFLKSHAKTVDRQMQASVDRWTLQ